MRHLRLTVLSLFLAVFAMGILFAEEVPDVEPMYGNPDCSTCHGTGRITPVTRRRGKKGRKQHVMYCYYKARGKRCNVMIGGWEPCSRCEDLPSMVPLQREHDACIAYYQEHEEEYDILKREVSFFRYHYAEGSHFRLLSNCSHSYFHGVIEALEEAWDIFAYEWGLLTKAQIARQRICFEDPEEDEVENDEIDEGWIWDSIWTSSPRTIYLVKTKEEYDKFIDWYWEKGGAHRNMGGKALLKRCASCGISNPMRNGRLIYWKEEISTHCSLVHFAGHEFLRVSGYGKLPHWLDEGFAKYMEYRVKGVTLTHCVKYGSGKKMDTDWQDSNTWKNKLKDAASRKSAFIERTNKWTGLIPMEIMEKFRIENISWQGMAQAWAMVCYLMGEGQKSKVKKTYIARFKKLLSGIATKGIEPEQQEAVIQEVYKMSGEELFKKFRKWLLRW